MEKVGYTKKSTHMTNGSPLGADAILASVFFEPPARGGPRQFLQVCMKVFGWRCRALRSDDFPRECPWLGPRDQARWLPAYGPLASECACIRAVQAVQALKLRRPSSTAMVVWDEASGAALLKKASFGIAINDHSAHDGGQSSRQPAKWGLKVACRSAVIFRIARVAPRAGSKSKTRTVPPCSVPRTASGTNQSAGA